MEMDFSKVGKKRKNKTAAAASSKALTVANPLDIKKAQEQFTYALELIKAMAQEADEMVIEDEDSVKRAVSLTGKVKTLFNQLDGKRKETTKPALQFQKGVKAFVDNFTDKLLNIEKVAKKKIGEYQYKVELDRRKKAKRQADAQEVLEKKMKEEAVKYDVEPVSFSIAPPVKEETVVARTDDGVSAFIKQPWKGTITDPSQVPRPYCEPSQTLINQAVKAGIREIPGVEIKQEIETNIRLS